MGLNQPIYVSPSVAWGVGNGTIDANMGLEVSWRVTGNVPMTSFQINVMANTAASTLLYSTTEITDNCPFYGTDGDGNAIAFTYTIDAATLAANNITNGNEYKLVITQWWSASESVTQTSASVFITRDAPSLTITNIPAPLTTSSYTFTAAYSQTQGDGLSYVRWQIALANDTANPFFDTQNIYGTSVLETTYEGFFTGENYAVQCTVQTENGVTASTGWVNFSVSYIVSAVAGAITAHKACGTSAVEVSYPSAYYINGTGSGTYSIDKGLLSLSSGASVVWDNVNGQSMQFEAPWTFAIRGITAAQNANLFTVTAGSDTFTLDFAYDADNSLATPSFALNGTTIWQPSFQCYGYVQYAVVITPTNVFISYNADETAGLEPSESLTPSDTLYPKASGYTLYDAIYSLSYNQKAFTSVTVNGEQTIDYIVLFNGAASADTINKIYLLDSYIPSFSKDTYLAADFSDGLSAGSFAGSGTPAGYVIYRRQKNNALLTFVANAPINNSVIYDYAVQSGQGVYTYYVAVTDGDNIISEFLQSNGVNPCFWNYAVIECIKTGKKTYTAVAEYLFGKNLATSDMSNNNTPYISTNFTRYPTVQTTPQNYKSGSLTSFIGTIDAEHNYSDTLAQRDAILALSTTQSDLFLKTRKGDLIKIRISTPIQTQTSDNTREQAQTIVLPWVECESADGVSITATEPV